MKLDKLIEQFQQLKDESDNTNFQKSVSRVISLLEQIENKDITNEEMADIQTSIGPYLENIQSQKDVKLGLQKLRKSLMGDFGFVPSNYYLTLGVGLGLALGTALGVSFGVHMDKGIVFGQMIGSGIGLIGGLVVGMFLDKKKATENRVLKNL